MTTDLPITLFFAAILILLSVPMAVAVGLRRAKTGILLLDGGDEDLLKRMRAHGNFIEYVPLALIGLAGAELSGLPSWLLVGCGVVLLAGRLIHYAALRGSAAGAGRTLGAGLTSLVLVVLAAGILLRLAGAV